MQTVQSGLSTSKNSWQFEKLYFIGDEYFSDLIQAIDTAQSTILLETYIFSFDSLGLKIIDKLISASTRGVSVRVLIDGVGTFGHAQQIQTQLTMGGVSTRIYNPLFRRVNKRNHRKTCIIDGKKAFVGSANITSVHLMETMGVHAWRDTCVQVAGSQVTSLTQAFESAWASKFVRRRYLENKNLLKKIQLAKQIIWITTAYFLPTRSIVRALKKAASSGVDVRLLIPQKSDVFFMPWIGLFLYASLYKKGVRIFEYLPTILHAKTIIVDQWSTVGSSNLNHRSFLHDLEVDIVLSKKDSKEGLKKQFLIDIQNSHEVTDGEWKNQPFWKRSIASLFYLLKYWL